MNTQQTVYEITVGTQHAIDTHGTAYVCTKREEWAQKICAHFGGVTILRERGGYIMQDGPRKGEMVFEDIYIYRVIELVLGERPFIDALAGEMAAAFGEECVLVTESKVKVAFVTPTVKLH